jgi:ribonucleoside-diphosphate reductase alpha chain
VIYMTLTNNALEVLKRRYLAKNEKGEVVETPDEMFRRVAHAVAQAEKNYGATDEQIKAWEDKFYEMMTNLEFLPNSPTLMNAGRPLGQLSACFVLPVEDSMEGIFEAVKNAALIHKSGGGTGFSFSRLRSKGSTVKTTGGVASGPVSFMKVFNAATEAVKQGGTRRGANMGMLRVDHPDILEFIDCKKDNKEITNFNISVAITDKFMEAVLNDEEYELIDPHTQTAVSKLKAKDVYNKIVEAAWRNGEPGVVYIDRINAHHPIGGEIEATNPCGEQPLLPYESCNLGSINLSKMLKQVDGQWVIDFEKLERTARLAVRFLDNVIDINNYPLPIIEQTTKMARKIGLGVMGFADMLLRLGISYNSEHAKKTAQEVMKKILHEGRSASIGLATERGECLALADVFIRNATITTIAPTGTLSIIASCSSGVEPVFAFAFERNIMDGTKLQEVNPILLEELERRGLNKPEIINKIISHGSLQHIDEIPEDMKRVFVCAHDITPDDHIAMQAAFQKYTDNAVSKTVNFPCSATIEDVDRVYKLAYELGCKGVTIYRDGSREGQVLSVKKEQKKIEQPKSEENKPSPRVRPQITHGFTEKVKIGCGNLYITVNSDDKGIMEIFTNTGKAGGCPSQSEATARVVSLALRAGVPMQDIIEQLKGIRCISTIRQSGLKALSCPDAIARVLERATKNNNAKVKEQKAEREQQQEVATYKCPECGCQIQNEGGCVICKNCGYSKCG